MDIPRNSPKLPPTSDKKRDSGYSGTWWIDFCRLSTTSWKEMTDFPWFSSRTVWLTPINLYPYWMSWTTYLNLLQRKGHEQCLFWVAKCFLSEKLFLQPKLRPILLECSISRLQTGNMLIKWALFDGIVSVQLFVLRRNTLAHSFHEVCWKCYSICGFKHYPGTSYYSYWNCMWLDMASSPLCTPSTGDSVPCSYSTGV